MSEINRIDFNKPIRIHETRRCTLDEDIKAFGLYTPELIEEFSPYLGVSFTYAGKELDLNKTEVADFFQLLRDNSNLSELIEDIGNLQCVAVDMDGNDLLHSQFPKNEFIDILAEIDSSLSDYIISIIKDWEHDFVTIETYKIVDEPETQEEVKHVSKFALDRFGLKSGQYHYSYKNPFNNKQILQELKERKIAQKIFQSL